MTQNYLLPKFLLFFTGTFQDLGKGLGKGLGEGLDKEKILANQIH